MNYILETNHLVKKHGAAYRVKDVNLRVPEHSVCSGQAFFFQILDIVCRLKIGGSRFLCFFHVEADSFFSVRP